MSSKQRFIDRSRDHMTIRRIGGDAVRRALRWIAIATTTADRERDDVALLQHHFVLRAQADRLAAAADFAIAGGAGFAAEHAIGRTAKSVAVQCQLHIIGDDLEPPQEAQPATELAGP